MVFDPTHPIHSGLPESDPIRENFVQLAVHHVGATEPPAKDDGFVWWDTSTPTNHKLRAYYNSAWRDMFEHMESNPVPVAGGGGAATLIKTTDDLEAIIEAAADGSSFELEDGVHTITGDILIDKKKDITIKGSRAAIITRAAGSTELFNIKGCENLVLEGFTLRTSADYGQVVIVMDGSTGGYREAKRHQYRNLFFETPTGSGDPTDGIDIVDNFIECLITGCHFSGRFYTGISMKAGGTDLCSGSIISNNQFDVDFTDGGMCIEVLDGTGKGVIVEGNYVKGPFKQGILVNDGDDVVVANNYVEGTTEEGIKVSPSSRCTVIGNKVVDATTDGIKVTGPNHIVQGNSVFSSTENGIELNNADNCEVSGNMLQDNGGYGILVTNGSTGNILDQNKFDNNTSGTYSIASAADVDNTVDGKVENSIATTDATVTTVSTIAIPDDTSVKIEVSVVAFQTNGAGQAVYGKVALVFRRSAGVATLQGAVQNLHPDVESDAAWVATIDVDGGNNARVRVTGAAGKDINWKARHTTETVG